ncbi:MAG: hypothetical protein JRI73_00710 [Deltaproteobacteria bacterium]|nr:hypothetical protein [Deltaproteobacteria bacterium]
MEYGKGESSKCLKFDTSGKKPFLRATANLGLDAGCSEAEIPFLSGNNGQRDRQSTINPAKDGIFDNYQSTIKKRGGDFL